MQTVVYQGVPGAFSYIAANAYFGLENNFIGMSSFDKVFAAVQDGTAQCGIVPIDNSIAGSVTEVYDLLFSQKLSIIGEHYIRVEHMLMGIPIEDVAKEARIQSLKKALSHPKALEQCTKFFLEHPGIEKTQHDDTAGAAQYVASLNDPAIAAIASRQAAELYGLTILQENIEDNPKNWTRFIVIHKEPLSFIGSEQTGTWKMSFLCTLDNKPGALYETLGLFAKANVNVAKLESRPIQGKPFEYFFCIDVAFSAADYGTIHTILKQLEEKTTMIRILGYYHESPTTPPKQ